MKTISVNAAIAITVMYAACALASPASQIKELTGGKRVRIAWGQGSKLVGFDTDVNGGAPKAITDAGGIEFLYITPGGGQVVYNIKKSKSACDMYVVNWDGSGKKKLGAISVNFVGKDPQGGDEWVYYTEGRTNSKPVYRFKLKDGPGSSQKFLDAQIGWSCFTVSADEKRGGGTSPKFGSTGLFEIAGAKFSKCGSGCQASIAPDNSYIFLENTNANHTDFSLYDWGCKSKRTFKSPYKTGEKSVGNPRFAYTTNDARYIVLNSPDANVSNNSGAEVIFIRMTPGCKAIDKWVRVTNDKTANKFPSAWISSGSGPVKTGIMHNSSRTAKEGKPVMRLLSSRTLHVEMQSSAGSSVCISTANGTTVARFNMAKSATFVFPAHCSAGIYIATVTHDIRAFSETIALSR